MKVFLALFLCFCIHLRAEEVAEVSDEVAFEIVQKTLKNYNGPYTERKISRAGNKTVVFESVVAIEADAKQFTEILSDVKNYPKWALKNINVRPSGGNYYVKILDLISDPKDAAALKGLIRVDLPLFKHSLQALFKVYPEEKKDVFTIRANIVPDERSVLVGANVILKAFPAPNRPNFKWIYVKANILIRYWLLYEALPDKLLNKESGERVQIVLDNYTDEETGRLKNQIESKPQRNKGKTG